MRKRGLFEPCNGTLRQDLWHRRRLVFPPRIFAGRCVGSLVESDLLNHVSSALEGRHFLEKFHFSVKNPDSHWSVCFVPGKGKEVTVKGFEVNSVVRRALSSVYHYLDSIFFCFPYDLIQGIRRSKCIGNMAKRKNLACRGFQVGGKDFPIQRTSARTEPSEFEPRFSQRSIAMGRYSHGVPSRSE